MTISATYTPAQASGNGVTVAFPFTFKTFEQADLVVIITDADDVDTTQTITTHYTVSLNADQNNNPGGTVTMLTAPASGTTLTIARQIDALQETDIANGGGFYPEVLEDALDRLTMLSQQNSDAIGRSFSLPITATGINTELPVPAANNIVGWNETGTALQNYDSSVFATVVSFGTAEADIFSGDGVTVAFTLTANPGALNNLDVSIAGVTQTPGVDYTWTSGTTITFTTAPPSGAGNVLVRYMQGLPQGSTTAELVSFDPTSGAATTVDAVLQDLYARDFATGEVLMYATAPSTWILLDENRERIDIAASTTDGLQEAIDYAYANGLNIRVLGGMSTGTPELDYGIIYCSTQVVWPPMRGCTVDLQGVIIAFTAAVTGDGMVFDSMQEVDFRLVGEITYQGNGDAVSFAPHSALPVDTTIGIGASRIYIGSIACPGGSPDSCVHFDTTNGSIISAHFEFEELNGAAAVGSPPKADYGIKVSVPSSSYAFEFNTIRANAIHEVILAGVQAGLSTTHADNIAANSYLIGQIQTNGTDADGFNTFGDSDADVSIGLIQAIGGNLKLGVYLQSSAANNTISVGSILGATTASVADLGTNNAVAYNGTYSWPVETRIAPTLAGTWTNLGAGQPDVTYWKDPFGMVHLEGAVTGGGADTIFTLPAGYRPAAAQLFPVVANAVFSYLQIATTGVVSCPAHIAVSLNGISFRT